MKMTQRNWTAIDIHENLFPNAGLTNLFRHKEEKSLFWSDPENVIKGSFIYGFTGITTTCHKSEVNKILESNDVWNGLGDFLNNLLIDGVNKEISAGILFWKSMMYSVAQNIEANKVLASYSTLLQLAVIIDAVDSVIMLLERGAKNKVDGQYIGGDYSAISNAIFFNRETLFQILLDWFPHLDVNEIDTDETYLTQAIERESVTMVQSLLKRGADVNLVNVEFPRLSPLQRICGDARSDDDEGLDLFKNYSPLHCSNCEKILIILLEANANVNFINHWGYTPLRSLILNDRLNWMESAFMCNALLEKKPIIDKSLLQLAADEERPCIWGLLFKAGYGVNFEIPRDLKVISALYFFQNK